MSGVDGKFWEFLKFFHATNQQWSADLVTINNDTWKKIKPEHQKAIAEWPRSSNGVLGVAFAADKDCAKKMIEGGMQLVTPPAAMMADCANGASICSPTL